ncbi:CbtA family protein [Pseudomonas aeruginosa]|jgi:cobalt transporter subunit CbtA|uniref:CbtA family protein n=1 Tax=Pseudomonas aeruginosa TaxID=287 RepID=UPI0009A93054|nr:CbtA family protein [Pseudomonas aeruginosa]ARH18784.1 cobalt transporter [Pseudomonas aeruginosa]WIK38070.1 CbtA family protein [Pseudomonas aeruginosa]HCL3733907.1 CbtA family protein [Pseudomonas aeruginosa]
MFKRILTTACYTGALAALLLTLLQSVWITPLILQAEVYESAESAHEQAQAHEHGTGAHEHEHDAEAWTPENGWQRTLSTFGGNLVVAVGFALMLSALYNLRSPAKAWHGVLWGLAGYAIFCLAPAAGLPPELPGTMAVELTSRQGWWGATALATAVGIALIVFGKHWFLRAIAVVLIAAPHLYGAPQPSHHHALAPDDLQAQFRVASLMVNAVFWIALGGLSSWWYARQQSGASLPINSAISLK